MTYNVLSGTLSLYTTTTHTTHVVNSDARTLFVSGKETRLNYKDVIYEKSL